MKNVERDTIKNDPNGLYQFYYPLMFESSLEPTIQTASVKVTIQSEEVNHLLLRSTFHQQFHDFFQMELLSLESAQRFLNNYSINQNPFIRMMKLSLIWFISEGVHHVYKAIKTSYSFTITSNASIQLTISISDDLTYAPLNTGNHESLSIAITTTNVSRDWKEWLYDNLLNSYLQPNLEDGLVSLQDILNNEQDISTHQVTLI
ncbi:hypothetical protein [Alkalihalobacillus pseudalcaliphilus]|uniref:hypothetical protein n=1 Tax=Alkalihalobacillus pseudalcaliphilus TaxID=79884 RepID=UPI00064D7DA7|nr:hypothetical protein [Alkalihalobacillus pseudalcaliphilus]KMK76059.1 hypothetical protein AB990_12570 [Alkalihalobacillus pseudalcaliphilus]